MVKFHVGLWNLMLLNFNLIVFQIIKLHAILILKKGFYEEVNSLFLILLIFIIN